MEGDYLAIYQKMSSGFFSIYPCLLIFTVSKSRPFDDTLECKQDINACLKNLSVLNFQLTECKKTNKQFPTSSAISISEVTTYERKQIFIFQTSYILYLTNR